MKVCCLCKKEIVIQETGYVGSWDKPYHPKCAAAKIQAQNAIAILDKIGKRAFRFDS